MNEIFGAGEGTFDYCYDKSNVECGMFPVDCSVGFQKKTSAFTVVADTEVTDDEYTDEFGNVAFSLAMQTKGMYSNQPDHRFAWG
ncbi:hypothetical protein GGI02_005095, partial [Coemansia sp. RSA 2322]